MNTPSSLPKETALGGLLKTLFTELERSGQSYCVCGNYEGLPEYTSHDVDIWASDVEAFEKILYASAEKNGLTLYLRNRLANGSNNFFYKTSPGIEFVHIDVLSECAWASFVPIVRSARIGEGRVKYRGFFVAEPIVESAMHLLYPLLHAGKVKDKYREKIFSFREEPRFALILEEAVGKDGAGELLAKISRRDWKGIEKNAGRYRLQAVLNSLARDNVRVARAFISFAWTNVARLFSPSGLFMAVMGRPSSPSRGRMWRASSPPPGSSWQSWARTGAGKQHYLTDCWRSSATASPQASSRSSTGGRFSSPG